MYIVNTIVWVKGATKEGGQIQNSKFKSRGISFGQRKDKGKNWTSPTKRLLVHLR